MTTREAEAYPSCPTPLIERGLTKLSLDRTGWPPKDGPGQMLGVAWWQQGLRDLVDAAERPGGEGAARVAVLVLLEGRHHDAILADYLVPRLDRALASVPVHDAQDARLRGRLFEYLGNHVAAAASYAESSRMDPGNPVPGLSEARSRLMAGDTSAATRWFEVAAARDARVHDAVRADLALIADSAELAAWDSLSTTGHPQWLMRFWTLRGLRSFHSPEERLVEHYRRVAVAGEKFRIRVYPRRYETYELWRNPTAAFDDRGLVYIRHGAPDTTVRLLAPGACLNESWLYRRNASSMVLHFVAREDIDDWRLVETIANVIGQNGATNRLRVSYDEFFGCKAAGVTRFDLAESRRTLDPIYWKLRTSGSRRLWEEELALATESREVATTTDSYPLRYEHGLTTVMQAYGLIGDQAGRALLVVALSGEALAPEEVSERTTYPVHLKWYALGAVESDRGSTDLAVPAARTIGQDEALTFFAFVPLLPGAHELGVVIEQPPKAAAVSSVFTAVHGRQENAAGIQVSDLVLGVPSGGLPWQSPAGEFHLNPSNVWTQDGELTIYYEVGGLAVGARYTVSIGVGEGKRAQRVSGTMVADGRLDRIIQSISLRGLPEGTHEVALTIEAPDGSRHLRTQLVQIVNE